MIPEPIKCFTMSAALRRAAIRLRSSIYQPCTPLFSQIIPHHYQTSSRHFSRCQVMMYHSTPSYHRTFTTETLKTDKSLDIKTTGPCYVHLSDLAAVRMTGVDAAKVFQSLSTQHFDTLLADPDLSGYAAWLTPKGRTVFETLVIVESIPDSVRQSAHHLPSPQSAPVKTQVNIPTVSMSLLFVLPRSQCVQFINHIRSHTLRLKSKISIADDLKVWSVLSSPPHDWNVNPTTPITITEDSVRSRILPTAPSSYSTSHLPRVLVDPRARATSPHQPSTSSSTTSSPYARPLIILTSTSTSTLPLSESHLPAPQLVYDVYRILCGWPHGGAQDSDSPTPTPTTNLSSDSTPSSPSSNLNDSLVSELVPEKTLPLEDSLDVLGGVHFHKGCYLGQELTARTHFQGLVRKRVVPFAIVDSSSLPSSSSSAASSSSLPSGPISLSDAVEPSASTSSSSPSSSSSSSSSSTRLFPYTFLPSTSSQHLPHAIKGSNIQATPIQESSSSTSVTATNTSQSTDVGKVLSVLDSIPLGMAMLRVSPVFRSSTPQTFSLNLTSSDTSETSSDSSSVSPSEQSNLRVIPLRPTWLTDDLIDNVKSN